MAENGFRAFQRTQVTLLNTISCIYLPKVKLNKVKIVLSVHSKRRPEIGFQDRLSLSIAECTLSAILTTFIKPSFVIKIFTFKLFIFEWALKTSFTVTKKTLYLLRIKCVHVGTHLFSNSTCTYTGVL